MNSKLEADYGILFSVNGSREDMEKKSIGDFDIKNGVKVLSASLGEKWSGKGENGNEIRRVTIGYHDRGKCLWWFIFNKKIMENIKIGSVNNYAEILKNELEKNKSYASKFTEYKGENALSEKENKGTYRNHCNTNGKRNQGLYWWKIPYLYTWYCKKK